MTVATLELAPIGTVSLPTRAGDGLTLDDVVSSVWEGLIAGDTASCPACGGEMTPRYAAGAAPVGGHCRSCAATLD